MKTLIRFIAGLALLGACCGPSASQGQPRGADPEGKLVDELLVRARVPGPAWWKVSDGDSTVWILGVPSGLAKSATWNDRPLRARLVGAKALILPPDLRPGPIKGLLFFIKHGKDFKSRTPLEQGLPEPLAQRFAADREKLSKPAGRYAKWRPAVAGLILVSDMRQPAKVRQDEPQAHAEDLASQVGVRTRRVGRYGDAMLSSLLGISEDAHRQCLEDMLAETEAGPQRIVAAGRGWADGDVRLALNVERGFDHCLASLPGISALIERGQADTAAVIKETLAKPGHAVAVVDLRALLVRGGVIERLRAQGLSVQTPDRLD